MKTFEIHRAIKCRAKTEYVQEKDERNGRQIVRKMLMRDVHRCVYCDLD